MSITRRLKSLKKSWVRNQIKPFAAWRAMRELLRNPDDTTQVFHIIEALKGDSLGDAVRRLRTSSRGRDLLQKKPHIVPALNDKEALLSLPAGSIGRAYYDFVHAENLSADGLIASSETASREALYEGLSDDEAWLADRLRDIHDLQHVMTGYGRDRVGAHACCSPRASARRVGLRVSRPILSPSRTGARTPGRGIRNPALLLT